MKDERLGKLGGPEITHKNTTEITTRVAIRTAFNRRENAGLRLGDQELPPNTFKQTDRKKRQGALRGAREPGSQGGSKRGQKITACVLENGTDGKKRLPPVFQKIRGKHRG